MKKNSDWMKQWISLGDDVADLVASELGLQNRRKVMIDVMMIYHLDDDLDLDEYLSNYVLNDDHQYHSKN